MAQRDCAHHYSGVISACPRVHQDHPVLYNMYYLVLLLLYNNLLLSNLLMIHAMLL